MVSLARLHPTWDRLVLLVDKREGRFDPAEEPFGTIEIEDLAVKSKYPLLFQYTLLEMSTAAKPWLLSHLFNEGYDRVVYFDPDILVCAPLDEVEQAWSRGALAILTPHLTGRLRDDKYPSEQDILLSGTYNLGFIALAKHAALESFLEYWREKSLASFAVDIKAGLFTDQKWIDPVPGMFPDVHILRHEGYNVAVPEPPAPTPDARDGGFRGERSAAGVLSLQRSRPATPGIAVAPSESSDIGGPRRWGGSRTALLRSGAAVGLRRMSRVAVCLRLVRRRVAGAAGDEVLYRSQRGLRELAGPNPFRARRARFQRCRCCRYARSASHHTAHGGHLRRAARRAGCVSRHSRPRSERVCPVVCEPRRDPARDSGEVRRACRGRSRAADSQSTRGVAAGYSGRRPRTFKLRSWLRSGLARLVSRVRRVVAMGDAKEPSHRRFDVDFSGFWPQNERIESRA